MMDNRPHGTSAVPEGYLFSYLANEASKEGLALVVAVMSRCPRLTAVCFCEVLNEAPRSEYPDNYANDGIVRIIGSS